MDSLSNRSTWPRSWVVLGLALITLTLPGGPTLAGSPGGGSGGSSGPVVPGWSAGATSPTPLAAWSWKKYFKGHYNRTRVIQVAGLCMALALFILMRKCAEAGQRRPGRMRTRSGPRRKAIGNANDNLVEDRPCNR